MRFLTCSASLTALQSSVAFTCAPRGTAPWLKESSQPTMNVAPVNVVLKVYKLLSPRTQHSESIIQMHVLRCVNKRVHPFSKDSDENNKRRRFILKMITG